MKIITIIILCFASICHAMDDENESTFTSISREIAYVQEQLIFCQRAFILSRQLGVLRSDVVVLDELLRHIDAELKALTSEDMSADEKATLHFRLRKTKKSLLQLSKIVS